MKNRLIIVSIIIHLLTIAFFTFIQPENTDTGFHIKTGEYIVTNRSIPEKDVFSYTSRNEKWIAHYWLSDVIFYVVLNLSGQTGLKIFTAFIVALTYFFVLLTIRLKTNRLELALLLLIPFTYLTSATWVVRPQIFSYLFLAIIIYILEKYKRDARNYIYFIPLVFFAWTNFHASTLLGVAIFGLFILKEIYENAFNLKKSKKLIIIFLLSVVATLINPYGYAGPLYFFYISSTIKNLNIAEWLPLLSYTSLWHGKLLLSLIVFSNLIIWTNLFIKKRLDVYTIGILLLGSILPFWSIRHIAYFPLIVFPIFIEVLNSIIENKEEYKMFNSRFLVLIFGIIFLIVPIYNLNGTNSNSLIDTSGAVKFILDNKLQTAPMFNSIRIGGNLILNGWPELKIFIDGRNEVHAGGTNQDYLSIVNGSDDFWNLVDQKYKIEYFVLSYTGPMYLSSAGIVQKLLSKDYRLVYWDDSSVIYLKNTPKNLEIINKYEYKVINPFLNPKRIHPTLYDLAETEFKRALNTSSQSMLVKIYYSRFEEILRNQQHPL